MDPRYPYGYASTRSVTYYSFPFLPSLAPRKKRKACNEWPGGEAVALPAIRRPKIQGKHNSTIQFQRTIGTISRR